MTEGGTSTSKVGDVAAAQAVAATVQQVRPAEIAGFDDLPRQHRRAKTKDVEQNRKLRLTYAAVLLVIMLIQVAIADVIFYLYGTANHWNVPASVISSWLAATVIEVIGVVVVITRFLFSKDSAT